MANIRTKSDIRADQRATDRQEHRRCADRLFRRATYRGDYPEPERGDVVLCPHGFILEFRGFNSWGHAQTRAIEPHKHPFLYAKAKKLIAEEALRQEERDSDGGS